MSPLLDSSCLRRERTHSDKARHESANSIAASPSAVVAALADPSVRRRLVDLGQEIYPRDQQTPEALHALQQAEIKKWWPIIKAE